MSNFNIFNEINHLKETAIKFVPTMIMSLLIFLLFLTIASYVKKFIIGNNNLPKNESQIYNVNNYSINLIYNELGNLVYYIIVVLGIIFAIINLGIQTATIITLVGAFGLTIALALQGILTNIVSGIYIAFNDLFNIGDTITVNGFTGVVQNFGLFVTTLQSTKNNSEIIIPNSMLQKDIIINYNQYYN